MTSPEQATPAQKPPKDASGGGIGEWLKDTYNGLYVIVLKPRMPEGILYSMAIIGVLLGIIWAYVVAPADWTGGNPNRMNESSQRQWLLMTAVGTSADNLYAPEQTVQLAQAIPNPRAQIEAMLADPNTSPNDRVALQTLLQQLPADIDATSAPQITSGNLIVNILMAWILPIIVIIVLVVIITLLWRFFIYDMAVAPVLQRIAEARDPVMAAEAQRGRDEIKIQQEQRRLREELAKQGGDTELGDPVMTQLAIYTPGRMFDESYEIELETGEFLGQSGTVIAEAVAPDPIAVEVWLFDMFTSRNIAKVFVTPQGYADPAIRSRLEADVDNPATDIVVAEVGKPLTIDTDKLRLQAKFSTLEINPNGRFEKFNMEMRSWNKDSASGAAPVPPTPIAAPPAGAPDMSVYDDIQFDPPPAGAPSMATYDNIQFDPPPPMPSRPSQGSSDFLSPPPMTPLSPPPLRPSNDDDDDPFGGTGDFTPLGN